MNNNLRHYAALTENNILRIISTFSPYYIGSAVKNNPLWYTIQSNVLGIFYSLPFAIPSCAIHVALFD